MSVERIIMFKFESLGVYQEANNFVIATYTLLKKFPLEERYALCDQMRRASISVPSNIAEVMSRISEKEQAHFIEIAYGSLMEVLSQFIISQRLGYITEADLNKIRNIITEIAKMLSGLRKYILTPKPSKL